MKDASQTGHAHDYHRAADVPSSKLRGALERLISIRNAKSEQTLTLRKGASIIKFDIANNDSSPKCPSP
ncbi:hypothetical protein LBMAG20_17120 [Methylocystaceae bacterium]|nr:hypothetical protein LBMAG20_17120 [Methylocystaceae bacterium]